jgi:hypothetical protein
VELLSPGLSPKSGERNWRKFPFPKQPEPINQSLITRLSKRWWGRSVSATSAS